MTDSGETRTVSSLLNGEGFDEEFFGFGGFQNTSNGDLRVTCDV
jgi:hypothetical protein